MLGQDGICCLKLRVWTVDTDFLVVVYVKELGKVPAPTVVPVVLLDHSSVAIGPVEAKLPRR